MIGSLVKYSCEKRKLYMPNCPPYYQFDGELGLVTEHYEEQNSIRVRWVRPISYLGRTTERSSFSLHSFEVVSKCS